MTKTIITQQAVFLVKADNDPEEIAQKHGSLQPEPEEEFVIDCPDCFDTMIKIYDSDKLRYQCENCDLTVGECGWL